MKNIVKRLGCTLLIACTVVSQVAVPTIVDAYTKSTISTGTYLLKNVYSGKYLNVAGSANANQTNVNIYTKSGATGQTFDISALAGEYVLSPKCASTRVLNIKGSSVTSGANVNIYSKDYSGDDTQLWAFEKVSNGYVVRSAGNEDCVLTADGTSDSSNVSVKTYSGS
ncbi:RICIN domain-containing protein, partial [Intestinibacter sp.]